MLKHQRRMIFSTMIRGSLLGLVSLGGCANNPQIIERKIYVTVPLTLPKKPELVKVAADSLECVDDATKWALLKRDVEIKNYISELETLIKSTNSK